MVETKFCSRCGAQIDKDAEICPKCGVRIDGMRIEIRKEEKPTAAFILSLMGGVLILMGGILAAIYTAICGNIMAMIPGTAGAGMLLILYGILGLISGIVVIIGATMINKAEPVGVRTGSVIVIVFSVVSIMSGGGFFIGMVLGIIGGALGLIWKP